MIAPAPAAVRQVDESREAARVVRRISRPRLWQHDYLMLKEIADGLTRQAAALNGTASVLVILAFVAGTAWWLLGR